MNLALGPLADPARILLAEPCEAVAIACDDGAITAANERMTALAGKIVGRELGEWLPPPDDAQLADALRGGRSLTLETTIGPAACPVRLSACPLPPRFGRRTRYVLRANDLTASRDLRHALSQAQRLQSLGQLAGGIAHDFNNLLTAILGAADELLEGGLEETAREDVAQIRSSATRGSALVRQLLAFGRQQTLIPSVIDVNQALEGVTGLLRRLLPRSVCLKLELESPGRAIQVDPSQFEQVIVNLAVNAGHAMPGGGTLTIASGHRTILQPEPHRDEVLPPGRYSTVEFRDTGTGIAPETLSRIFEPFFTTRRESGGTGLGLSTVHGIVRQSGGYLTVDSEVGIGTCFRLYLPRHEPSQAVRGRLSAPPVATPRRPGAKRQILLVDDEGPIRKLAERYLTSRGWEVTAVASAAEALESTADPGCLSALSCVISDIVMPGMDGAQLVATLRRRIATLPAILVSGYAEPEQREALRTERIRFLAKPFAMKELLAAIEAAVAG